jgi:hypothetical protein
MTDNYLIRFKRMMRLKESCKGAIIYLRLLLPVVIIMSISLVSCSSIFSSPTLSPVTTQTFTPAEPVVTPSPDATQASTIAPLDKLVIWLPPQFDPAVNTPAAKLLKNQLDAFSLAHNNIPIEVRIKAVSGPGALLDALSAANAAAPLALPDLVALSRSDLEAAALKGLLAPFDGSSATFDDADWFAYARQMTLLQVYHLPEMPWCCSIVQRK